MMLVSAPEPIWAQGGRRYGTVSWLGRPLWADYPGPGGKDQSVSRSVIT